MASPASSQNRSPPLQSPSQSIQKSNNPLDSLVSHLVASKRSLNSIHHVHRATTLLSEARRIVESSAAISAKSKYLQKSLATQAKVLRRVQYELEEVSHDAQAEFTVVLKELDEAGKRLMGTLSILKTTELLDGFLLGQLPQTEVETAIDKTRKTLYDFVDGEPVTHLQHHVKSVIDEVQAAKKEMDNAILHFDDQIQSVNDTTAGKMVSSSSTHSELPIPKIPALMRDLEEHANLMAEGLESLVKHFDLCVTAIKHADGGGAAVAQYVSAGELPEGVGAEVLDTTAKTIGEAEWQEMMNVIETDAAEVDEVVIEIQDRIADMDLHFEQVQTWKDTKDKTYDDMLSAYRILEEISTHLNGYIEQSSSFVAKWQEAKVKIREDMVGLEDLGEVYANFLYAYDGMIVEAARRMAVRHQMEKIVKDAQAKLDQLYEDDEAERQNFRTEQGDFLPADIWPGLSHAPARFAFEREDEALGSTPELPREKVQEALKRLKASQR